MAFGWMNCSHCNGSDPATDTVKVDSEILSPEADEEVQRRREAEEREAESERQRREAEEREAETERERQRCETAAEQERQRQQDEAAAADAAAAARTAEEERSRQQKEAEDSERQRKETEDEAARKKVNSWLKENGFNAIDAKKKSVLRGSKFPLHAAVAKKDAEMVTLLIRCQADPNVPNSSGQTPLQVAQKGNKNGSHDAVIAALGA